MASAWPCTIFALVLTIGSASRSPSCFTDGSWGPKLPLEDQVKIFISLGGPYAGTASVPLCGIVWLKNTQSA